MPAGATLVSAAKGLEEGTLLRMSEVLRAELAGVGAIVVLSGPSFAIELARELPTAMVAAGDSTAAVEKVQAEFRSSALRLYGSADVVGVEIGGALKNIIAIAAGVVEGLGLGHNALAALITRGLAELSRLAVGLGAQRETLSGLAGLGDLVLTCTGELSRNRHVGMALARGRSLQEILRARRWSPKACGPPKRRWRSARGTASSCRSRKRWRTCSRDARRPQDADPRADGPAAERHGRHVVRIGVEISQSSVRTEDCPTTNGFDKHRACSGRRSSSPRSSKPSCSAPTRRSAHARRRCRDAEALEEILLMADVGVAATDEIVEAVRKRARRGESLRELVKQEILRIFNGSPREPHSQIMMASKPTWCWSSASTAPARRPRSGSSPISPRPGQQPLICAADTFRAAAVDQLQIWADRAGVDMVRAREGSDPAAVVFDALTAAARRAGATSCWSTPRAGCTRAPT